MSSAHEPWNEARGAEIISEHSKQEGATLPILHALQEAFGYVPEPAILMVAAALNLSRAEVYGVFTFYHDFRKEPAGRHVLKLCRAEACQSMGADALLAHAELRLGCSAHGRSADGRFTLEPVFCLGLCASSPALMLDDELHARVTPKSLDALIAGSDA